MYALVLEGKRQVGGQGVSRPCAGQVVFVAVAVSLTVERVLVIALSVRKAWTAATP